MEEEIIDENSLSISSNNINTKKISYKNKDKSDLLYKIVDIICVIGNHSKEAEYIKEISNGNILISGGTDNNIIFYDNKSFDKIKEIKELKEWPNNIYEKINKEKDEKSLELIACYRNEIAFIIIDSDKNKFIIKSKTIKKISIVTCFEMRNNSYIISGETGIYHIIDHSNYMEKLTINKILEGSYMGGIRINKNKIVYTSNSILPNGSDQLIFYNFNTKKISKTIKNNSFSISQNGLSLMELNENKKILLCACKKYSSNQKNGILLVNPDSEERQEISNPFYDTNTFEVLCFCQIFVNKNNKTYNNFFFVGGFDTENGEGMIKLYKLIYNDKVCNTKIEYILDIVFENNDDFLGFERPISSIIQCKNNGNIILSSWDGNIYLLTEPNLDFFVLD